MLISPAGRVCIDHSTTDCAASTDCVAYHECHGNLRPADVDMGRDRQLFTSPTECSTTIRRYIHPGAPDNSGWRFIK